MIKQRLDKFGNRIRTPTQATANKALYQKRRSARPASAPSRRRSPAAHTDDLLRAYGERGWASDSIKNEAPNVSIVDPGLCEM